MLLFLLPHQDSNLDKQYQKLYAWVKPILNKLFVADLCIIKMINKQSKPAQVLTLVLTALFRL